MANFPLLGKVCICIRKEQVHKTFLQDEIFLHWCCVVLLKDFTGTRICIAIQCTDKFLTHSYRETSKRVIANSADPDWIPHNVASDQGLQCLLQDFP